MFIAMNKFQVAPGKGAEFERIWAERESHLDQVPGFVRFALLRSDTEGEYVSHSTWEAPGSPRRLGLAFRYRRHSGRRGSDEARPAAPADTSRGYRAGYK